MALKVYGHPWSINTLKTLFALAEKGHEAELVLIMIPKGEQRSPEHMARHPFGKVPVLEHDGLVVYESSAIGRYLDRTLSGPALVPTAPREAALVDQWLGVLEAYFAPQAGPLIVEAMFRKFLGGPQNTAAMTSGREGMLPALDAAERRLRESPHFAGQAFSLADIHWLPYIEYLVQSGEGEPVNERPNLRSWFGRVSEREAWRRVARTGPRPYHEGVTAAVVEEALRS